jgi:type IV secretory pathway TrbF-like protein
MMNAQEMNQEVNETLWQMIIEGGSGNGDLPFIMEMIQLGKKEAAEKSTDGEKPKETGLQRFVSNFISYIRGRD